MAGKRIEIQITGRSDGLEKAFSRSGSAASRWGSTVGKGVAVAAAAAGTAITMMSDAANREPSAVRRGRRPTM